MTNTVSPPIISPDTAATLQPGLVLNSRPSEAQFDADEAANPIQVPAITDDLKSARIAELKEKVQDELQRQIVVASSIRKNINESKTDVKKKYFTKKFKKVNNDVLRLVYYLQHLEQLEAQANGQQPTEETAADENTPAAEAV